MDSFHNPRYTFWGEQIMNTFCSTCCVRDGITHLAALHTFDWMIALSLQFPLTHILYVYKVLCARCDPAVFNQKYVQDGFQMHLTISRLICEDTVFTIRLFYFSWLFLCSTPQQFSVLHRDGGVIICCSIVFLPFFCVRFCTCFVIFHFIFNLFLPVNCCSCYCFCSLNEIMSARPLLNKMTGAGQNNFWKKT